MTTAASTAACTTATPAATTTRPAPRRNGLLTGTRVLLGLFGAFKLYGTVYFTFFATAAQGGDPQGAVDWLVAAWSTALAVSLVAAAVLLGRGDRRSAAVTGVLLIVEIAFSIVKFFGYDEPEAVLFMGVDVLLLGLIALAVRRGR